MPREAGGEKERKRKLSVWTRRVEAKMARRCAAVQCAACDLRHGGRWCAAARRGASEGTVGGSGLTSARGWDKSWTGKKEREASGRGKEPRKRERRGEGGNEAKEESRRMITELVRKEAQTAPSA